MQFELTEVGRPFLLRPGNEANIELAEMYTNILLFELSSTYSVSTRAVVMSARRHWRYTRAKPLGKQQKKPTR